MQLSGPRETVISTVLHSCCDNISFSDREYNALITFALRALIIMSVEPALVDAAQEGVLICPTPDQQHPDRKSRSGFRACYRLLIKFTSLVIPPLL